MTIGLATLKRDDGPRVAGSGTSHGANAVHPAASIAAMVVLVLVCWWGFAYPFLHTEFTNDDFEHLSKARQVLFSGELPDRDFYDDGRPLTIAISVVAQLISPTLLSELFYRAGFIAAGAALVYLLSYRLTRAIPISVLAALLTIAIKPRLYNYSKVFVFPLALWLLWRYVDRPTRGRLAALAGATVAAFLFRNDYGLYIALIAVCTMVGIHRKEALRPIVFYAAVGIAACLPYFTWLVVQGRLSLTAIKGFSTMASKVPVVSTAPFHLDLSHGLVYVGPVRSHIGVRWRQDVDVESRKALERRYGLELVSSDSDGRSYTYVLDEPTPERVQRLISDPRVEDTRGIDRSSGTRLEPGRWDRWQAALPLLRLKFAEIFPTPEDGAGWLYLLFTAVVPVAFIAAIVFRDTGTPHARVKVLSLALLCLLLHHFLLIKNVPEHLANVAPPTAVLMAWLVSRSVDGVRSLSRRWRWMLGSAWSVALAVLLLVTWLSVATFTATPLATVLSAGVAPRAAFGGVVHDLNVRPLDYWTGDNSVGTPALIRYVARCLSPNDRLLMVSFAPEVFYISERLFAGGVNSYHDNNGFNSSGPEVLKRLRHQSVPLVIVDQRYDGYARDWGEVASYVASRYREAAVTTFHDRVPYRIFVDSQRRPVRTDDQWGLPCFTER